MKTFTFPVTIESSSAVEFPVNTVKFGDGYEQRSPKTFRAALEKWQVSTLGTKHEIDQVKRFLDEHAGVKAFLWRLDETEDFKTYTVKGYKRNYKGGALWSLEFEMREVVA